MNLKSNSLLRLGIVTLVAMTAISAKSEQQWFGGAEDVTFAVDLWGAMEAAELVGPGATNSVPYIGMHPHGAILESSIDTITVNGSASTVVTKRSYRGVGISIEAVSKNREAFLEDVTVMFKREAGYDTDNQDWFWAKYNADGGLATTPNGVSLAGRIAKGKPKGCIACHRKAEGDDFLYIN